MLNKLCKQSGFTLIEVVAAAALIGVLATMLAPSLSGANDKVKNAKLTNDLATIDQAIQIYRMDNGSLPDSLSALDSDYLGGKLEFKDATGTALVYSPNDNGTYTLTGKNAKGADVSSPASSGGAAN